MGINRDLLRQAARRPLVCVLAFALVYLALARLSLVYVSPDTGVAALWPASGVALAAFALAPRRWWPAFCAAVFFAVALAELLAGEGIALAAVMGAVNVVEASVAGWVFVRVAGAGRRDITSVRTVGAIATAAFGANALTAVLAMGALVVAVGGPPLVTWQSWWLADGVGMVVVAPLLLALVRPTPGRAGRLEAVGLVGLTAGVTVAIVSNPVGDGPILLGYAFPVLPLLLWCALRLGTRAIGLAIVLVSLIIVFAMVHDLGPFAVDRLSPVERGRALQGFLALAVLSTLVVAAVVASQRRAERRAFDEAERLASVLRSSEAAIITLDLGGAITHWNAGAERMLGYPAQDMLGRRGGEIFDPAELEARAAEVGLDPGFELFAQAALAAERRDWTWITADGRRLTVSLTMSVQRDHAGRLIGFLAMASDVTAQREATRRLAASEERHRLVLANLPDTQVYLYDRDLVCVLGEGQAIAPGFTEADYLGRPAADLLALGGIEHLLPSFESALRGVATHTSYVSPLTGRHHEMHLLPHRDAAGEPNGVLVVMHDTTERYERDQAVLRAEADLRTIFDEAPIGNAVFDGRLRLIEVNAALTAMTGYESDELKVLPIERLIDGDEAARLIDLLVRVSRGQRQDEQTELAFRHADGHTVELSLHIVGLGVDTAAGGTRRRTLVQVVDVSERKRLEDRLRHLADHDSMTGLMNRRRFEAELAAHAARARRYGRHGAVMVADVDGFKRVNDTRGHAAGDDLIVALARVLRSRLRTSDALARLGGDEFAILLPEGSADGFAAVAADLVAAVRTQTDVSISVGVAALTDATALTADQILRDADAAMYAAKAAGRDGYVVFTTDRAVLAARPSSPTS